jgi:hypothetical protein
VSGPGRVTAGTITIRVPLKVRTRGGRKMIVAPDGAAWVPRRPRIDNAMIKAFARAHRWKRLLETGKFESLTELAAAENINLSYIGRVLRLTLLAPDLVEAILNGLQPAELQLEGLLRPLPAEWNAQRRALVYTMSAGSPYPQSEGQTRNSRAK